MLWSETSSKERANHERIILIRRRFSYQLSYNSTVPRNGKNIIFRYGNWWITYQPTTLFCNPTEITAIQMGNRRKTTISCNFLCGRIFIFWPAEPHPAAEPKYSCSYSTPTHSKWKTPIAPLAAHFCSVSQYYARERPSVNREALERTLSVTFVVVWYLHDATRHDPSRRCARPSANSEFAYKNNRRAFVLKWFPCTVQEQFPFLPSPSRSFILRLLLSMCFANTNNNNCLGTELL